MSWDIALSETESGDYSACVVLLRRREVFYVLEVVRGRFPFDTLIQKVMEVKRRYASGTLLIEDSPISRGLIQNLRDKSINVTDYKPDTDKRARVIAQSDMRHKLAVRSQVVYTHGAFPDQQPRGTSVAKERRDKRRAPGPATKGKPPAT
jgi:phage terminase large subunit-like protein